MKLCVQQMNWTANEKCAFCLQWRWFMTVNSAWHMEGSINRFSREVQYLVAVATFYKFFSVERCFAVVHDKKVAEACCYNLRKILKFIHPLSFWEIASCGSMFYVFTILDYPSVKIAFSIRLEYLHVFTLFTEAIKMVWEALI